MGAMPSPTLRTVPTSDTCASVPKLAIWSLMTFEISAALISMFSLSSDPCGSSALHCLGESVQTGTDGTVDHLATDLDDQPAEDCGIDFRFHCDFATDT